MLVRLHNLVMLPEQLMQVIGLLKLDDGTSILRLQIRPDVVTQNVSWVIVLLISLFYARLAQRELFIFFL